MIAHGGCTMVDRAATSETDLQRYLKTTSDEYNTNPPVPPKDSPSISSNVDPYFNPRSISRTESIFSFSRATFSSQLSSLTSMNLPSSESLSASISAIPTAPKAVRALANAADQIQMWAGKAIKILSNLDADDDVEWAAAAGREGLDETDKAVRKFETLVEVYVQAIDELQMRSDVGDVDSNDLQAVVDQMESTLRDWDNVRKSLTRVHDQVELAMEWEELWGTVLGDVGEEMESLSRLVFEMEEKRHMSMRDDAHSDGSEGIDLNELESLLHEGHQKIRNPATSRFSLPSGFTSSPLESPALEKTQNDSNLLALFARMQPLRASLDFLPMRLSMFQARAEKIFPSACKELEEKRTRLEKGWKTLEKEAEDLRRELGEDRWILVFRNAGRQAQKMCESVERSITKLQEAIDTGVQHTNPLGLAKRVESFEAKRMHYGPAIDRVLAIIQKGVRDRLTVNGEILRLHGDMTARVQAMHQSMSIMETTLEEANANHNSQLRDSISSIISMDRSMAGSFNGTPGSSPASSVVVSGGKHDITPAKGPRGYRSTSSSCPTPAHNRYPSSGQNRRPATPLSAHSNSTLPARAASPSPGVASVYRQGLYKPPTAPIPRPAPTPLANKPRWSSTGKSSEPRSGYSMRSVSSTQPSLFTKHHQNSISGSSFPSLPAPSPLGREATSSPSVPTIKGTRRGSHLQSFAERAGQSPAVGVSEPLPYHRGRNMTAPVHSSSNVGTIRSPSSLAVHNRTRPTMNRPPSSLAHQRSSSRVTSSNRMASLAMGDSAIDMTDDDLDIELEHKLEEQLSSSPSVRPKPAQRPGSVATRRLSMLPIPTSKTKGPSSNSGRESSLGNRPAWK
jgi:Yeast cortical protein KAR9